MNTSEYVRNLILERIERKAYKPGERIDTFRKLATDADTSTPTVSRAINRLVQDGYLCAKPSKGYYVRTTPGGGAVRGTTGLLLGIKQNAKLSSNFAGKRFRDILPILNEGSIRLNRAMLTLGGFVENHYLPMDVITARQLEALLVLGIYDNRFLTELSKVQGSVIVLDLDTADIGLDSVSFDHIGSGIAMVRHLASIGRKRIAYFGRPIAPGKPSEIERGFDPCARERHDGYLAGLRACGFSPETSLIKVPQDQSENATRSALKELAALDRMPDAVVAESPSKVLTHLKELGLADRIPVATWAPTDIFATHGPMLACTSVIDFDPLGVAAMDVLALRLENPDGPVQRRKVFPKVMMPDGSILVAG